MTDVGGGNLHQPRQMILLHAGGGEIRGDADLLLQRFQPRHKRRAAAGEADDMREFIDFAAGLG